MPSGAAWKGLETLVQPEVRAAAHTCHHHSPPGSQELALADRVLQIHGRELPLCHVEGSKREAGRCRHWGGDASAGDITADRLPLEPRGSLPSVEPPGDACPRTLCPSPAQISIQKRLAGPHPPLGEEFLPCGTLVCSPRPTQKGCRSGLDRGEVGSTLAVGWLP